MACRPLRALQEGRQEAFQRVVLGVLVTRWSDKVVASICIPMHTRGAVRSCRGTCTLVATMVRRDRQSPP